MNANEISNETIIPSEASRTYIEWDAEQQRYMLSLLIDPSRATTIKIPLGARNRTFLSDDKPLGKYIIHMAEQEAIIDRNMKESGQATTNRWKAIETISTKVIETLQEAGVTDTDICEIFEDINDDLPSGWELTKPKTTYRVAVEATIEITIERTVEVEASSSDDAEEMVRENISDYIDLGVALESTVSGNGYSDYDFSISASAQ